MTFKGWQKTSLIEYPGKVATVLFTGGCNFRCPFCYNADLVQRPQELADLPGETVLEYLRTNRGLYQALVISGGEPTLNAETPEFLAEVKALDLCTGLETNGTNPDMIAGLLKEDLVDYIAMDVKAPLTWEAYRRAAGLNEGNRGWIEKIRATLELLKTAKAEIELRCTLVPKIHNREDLLNLARQLQGHRRFVLQQFVPERALDPLYRDEAPFNAETLRELRSQIADLFGSCEVRGI
ncbi:MAG: anaerobic ribonucleoside-triphosphate reductase activating protein [Spirochaetia bacterium]